MIDQFSLELLELIGKNKVILDFNKEESLGNLECPVSLAFPMKQGVLCVRDGRTYEFEELANACREMPIAISPVNRFEISLKKDLIIHPVHQRILQQLAAAPNRQVNLIEILTDFQQPDPQFLRPLKKAAASKFVENTLLCGTILQLLPPQLINLHTVLKIPGPRYNVLLPIAAEYIVTRYHLSLMHHALRLKDKYGNRGHALLLLLYACTTVVGVFCTLRHHRQMLSGILGKQAPMLFLLAETALAMAFSIPRYRQTLLLTNKIFQTALPRLGQRFTLRADEEFSFLWLVKRTLDACILLSAIVVVIASFINKVNYLQQLGFFGSHNSKILAICLSAIIYWPDQLTVLLAADRLTESLFGENNPFNSLSVINIFALLTVALTLFPASADYTFANLTKYTVGLTTIGSQYVMCSYLEGQDDYRPPIANRYRLLPAPELRKGEESREALPIIAKKMQ